MTGLQCSKDKPWGMHQSVRNDEDCPRCGWTAPGPKGDARAAAREQAAAHGWVLIEGGAARDGQQEAARAAA